MPSFPRRIAGIAVALALAAVTATAAPGKAAASAPATSPVAVPVPASAAPSLPALPAAWPSSNLEIGLADSPNGAAALHSSGAYKFRYQYLCGGVNTGSGWATWNANAKFADYYVDESVAQGITPVFIYYQLLQSSPAGGAENVADLANLKNTSTMKSYWADFRLLMQHLGAYSKTIVIDVEPDLWGYIEQASTADNGASIPAAVASSGDADMAGLPNNAAGFAQGITRLRDMYARNVLLGYHMSIWGTMTDIIYSNSSNADVDSLAARSAAFESSLGAAFDIAFGDPTDRDAEFHHIINGQTESWWSAADYAAYDRYIGDFVAGVGLRMVLWQIPLGNTRMRAMDNTWGHYQDNHVEWWLDDASATHLAATADAGVVALLYGGGADGTTSAYDAEGDGVTNPAAINGNTRLSYSADDDGGYFRHQTNAYYTAGAMALPDASPPVEPDGISTFHPLLPVRLLDTRYANGLSGALIAGVPEHFQITGRGGIPDGATAVTANATIVKPSASASIYLGPTDLANPPFATMNFNAGSIKGAASTIALGDTGLMSVTYMAPSGTTDLVLDVTGFFTPDTGGDTYHPLPPARLLDSRYGNGLAGKFRPNSPRPFKVAGRGGVPANARAVTGNLTVANATGSSAAYIGPGPIKKPSASMINFAPGQIRGNSITVLLSSTGYLWATFMATRAGGSIDLVFDVTGFYTADGSGYRYVPLTPAPLLDTTAAIGLSAKLGGGVPATFTVWGAGGVPDGAKGITGIVAVVNQTGPSALYVGPGEIAKPLTSSLNFTPGDNCSNGLTVGLSPTGTLSLTYMSNVANTTDARIVVTGYFVK
jgi:hypothetical protein